MAQTGLFESKGKLFEKDVDRGLELSVETLTENGQGNIRTKADLEAFEAKQKVRSY